MWHYETYAEWLKEKEGKEGYGEEGLLKNMQ